VLFLCCSNIIRDTEMNLNGHLHQLLLNQWHNIHFSVFCSFFYWRCLLLYAVFRRVSNTLYYNGQLWTKQDWQMPVVIVQRWTKNSDERCNLLSHCSQCSSSNDFINCRLKNLCKYYELFCLLSLSKSSWLFLEVA